MSTPQKDETPDFTENFLRKKSAKTTAFSRKRSSLDTRKILVLLLYWMDRWIDKLNASLYLKWWNELKIYAKTRNRVEKWSLTYSIYLPFLLIRRKAWRNQCLRWIHLRERQSTNWLRHCTHENTITRRLFNKMLSKLWMYWIWLGDWQKRLLSLKNFQGRCSTGK